MKSLRQTTLVAMIAALSFASLACDSSGDKGGERRRRRSGVSILVVGDSQDSASWTALRETAIRFGKERFDVGVSCIAPERRSPDAQRAMLASIKSGDCDAVCILPLDPRSLNAEVDSLVDSGCPVAAIGRDIPDSKRLFYAGPVDSELGLITAEACKLAVADRNKTVMLLHDGSEQASDRERYVAFEQAMDRDSDVQLLAEIACGGVPLDAAVQLRTKAKSYPRLGCWACLDDWPFRAIATGERLAPQNSVVVLCNSSPDYFDRVRSGEVFALIAFDYHEAILEALSAVSRIASTGEHEVMTVHVVPPEIVTKRELASLERRWRAWRLGRPSPAR